MTIKILVSLVILLCPATAVLAQRQPTFSRYAVKVERHKNVRVDLRTRNARMFRTNLRNAAKGGVNFAGHYIFTQWGCGTNCTVGAIIDARNGRVYFPDELEGAGVGFCEMPDIRLPADTPQTGEYEQAVHFKPSSRLLILEGHKGGDLNRASAKCGYYFFEWTGNTFRQVRFVAGKRTDQP